MVHNFIGFSLDTRGNNDINERDDREKEIQEILNTRVSGDSGRTKTILEFSNHMDNKFRVPSSMILVKQ